MIIKKSYLLLSLLFAFNSIQNFSQNSVNFSFHQDFKLLALGDDLGNRAGTFNFLGRLKYESQAGKIGYYVFGTEYEEAILSTKYSRLGGFLGYSFMDVFNNYNIHITPTIGYGKIFRAGTNLNSWSGAVEFQYFINDKIRVSLLNQVTQRTDLEFLYDDLKYRYSFFLGVEFKLFTPKKN